MSDKMKEYIEREAALKWQVPHYSINGVEIIESKAIPVEYIENLPVADVVEVRHGWWKWDGFVYDAPWQCSECGTFSEYKSNYCPNCGTKMDGDIKNDDNI